MKTEAIGLGENLQELGSKLHNENSKIRKQTVQLKNRPKICTDSSLGRYTDGRYPH